MKAATSTIVLVTGDRIARADFDGDLRSTKSAPRPVSASAAEVVRAALALGGKAARETWVLSADVWRQEVKLNAAQIAGLTREQLGRALSFEAEPFSGIPVAESATGFRDEGGGAFNVVQMPRADLDAVARAVASAGGRLAGIVHPGSAPEDDEALLEWWPRQPARMAGAPIIRPPDRGPSPHRFFVTGLILEAAAIGLLAFLGYWNAARKKGYENRQAEFAVTARALEAANQQNQAWRAQLATLEKQEQQRGQVQARRGALLALLKALAAARTEDVLVRGFAAEGPSSLVVSGIALEAGAVDELSIVLSQQLRAVGWIAQARSKAGTKNMVNGGPWEFALVLTHTEAAQAPAVNLSQHTGE